MALTAFGHALETIHDGLTVFHDGRPVPVPLVETRIDVDIRAGLATVRTLRRFQNTEERPIEALLTMPVGFDAVVTGLTATIDGRTLTATAAEKESARESYETALDEGKLTVLHEELMRGIHMLSVGNLAPGKEVEVEIEAVSTLTVSTDGPFLRIPVTVGQLYGASPFSASDNLVTSAQVRHVAQLTVRTDAGDAKLIDGPRLVAGEPVEVTLDAAIEICVEGGTFGALLGSAADGQAVRLELKPVAAGDRPLDLTVLVDHSGSTASRAGRQSDKSAWAAIRDGLLGQFETLGHEDRVDLWEFDDGVRRIGQAKGHAATGLLLDLSGPAGGTNLGGAVRTVLDAGARDILVLTDGQTWARTVNDLASSKARISAILVGPGSLDANIGQLCAATGGQVFYAPGDDVGASVAAAFKSLRNAGTATEGETEEASPRMVKAVRGGVELTAHWSTAEEPGAATAIGRFAAALALPLLDAYDVDAWARTHSLCTHRTSLVLIDEAGERVEGMAQMRKVPLMEVSEAMSMSASAPMMRQYRRSDAESASYSMRSSSARVEFSERRMALRRPPSTETRNRVRGKEPLTSLFANLPWDVLAEDFLLDDLSALNESQREAVQHVASSQGVIELAQTVGQPVNTIALALIADHVGGRLASRFARKVLGSLDPAEWEPLRLSRRRTLRSFLDHQGSEGKSER